jgi:2-polyprenyl-3-methyl-5-hydroxy-6-metoxy-1,4-benzoquinol methylase
MSKEANAIEFWNQSWQDWKPDHIDPANFRTESNRTQLAFLDLIGDVEGQHILEIGSGKGHLAVYLAKQGATVTATDIAPKSAALIRQNAEQNSVADRVTARTLDALDLNQLETTYSLVVGRFVLHHIEPFSELVEVLNTILEPGGRGIFLENNARNKLLILARNHLVGRLGIPKHGDDDEHPLTAEEINALRTRFDVQCHFPELVLLKKINTYILQYRDPFEKIVALLKRLDNDMHRWLPFLRKYSYLQVVEFSKSKERSSVPDSL